MSQCLMSAALILYSDDKSDDNDELVSQKQQDGFLQRRDFPSK